MANVSQLRTQIADLIGFDASDSTNKARFLRYINNARRELAKAEDWEFLRKQYTLRIPPDVTAGTVTMTNGSHTVTGDGTAFDSSMVGSYITIGQITASQSEFYRIASVSSSTSLELETQFIGNSGSSLNYVIRKIYHRIPGDARKIANLLEFVRPLRLKEEKSNLALTLSPDYQRVTGEIQTFGEMGLWRREGTYTTGTVSGSANSRVLTGSGTAWLSNVIPGDKIEINGDTNDYYVDRVDSDTQITLYQKLESAVSSSTTYTATENPDSIMIRFINASDAERLVQIEYFLYPFDLINDNDEDEFTRRFPELVIKGALIYERRSTDDPEWKSDIQEWRIDIAKTIGSMRRNNIWVPAFHTYSVPGGD